MIHNNGSISAAVGDNPISNRQKKRRKRKRRKKLDRLAEAETSDDKNIIPKEESGSRTSEDSVEGFDGPGTINPPTIDDQTANRKSNNCAVQTNDDSCNNTDGKRSEKDELDHHPSKPLTILTEAETTDDTNITIKKDSELPISKDERNHELEEKKVTTSARPFKRRKKHRSRIRTTLELPTSSKISSLPEQTVPVVAPNLPLGSTTAGSVTGVTDDDSTKPIHQYHSDPSTTAKKNYDDITITAEELECRFLRCAKRCLFTDSVAIIPSSYPSMIKTNISESTSVLSPFQVNDGQTDDESCDNAEGGQSEKGDLDDSSLKPYNGFTKAETTDDTNVIIKEDSEPTTPTASEGEKNSTNDDSNNVVNAPSGTGQTSIDREKVQRYDIFVKPLLVLDLNGVLCHRYRSTDVPMVIWNAVERHNKQQQVDAQPGKHNQNVRLTQNTDETTANVSETQNTDETTANASEPNGTDATPQKIQVRSLYRTSIAHIAGTPIIPREHLDSFLTMLDQSFTLAIWTSAQAKTAKQMVKALIPPAVRSRLLFVWGQNRCHGARGQVNRKFIFRKPLSKVWETYPIWNEHNTLLMDDSPEKCPKKYMRNTLHPPPISGLNASAYDLIRKENALNSDSLPHTKNVMDEEYIPFTGSNDVNIERQDTFFRKLVVDWKSTLDDKFLASYLPKFGTEHMGCRVPVKR